MQRVIIIIIIIMSHKSQHRVIAQSHCTESLLMRILYSVLLFLGRRGRADSALRKSALCGDRRGRGQKTGTFYDFCGARATLCEDSCGRGQKTEDFLRFLICARPSAEIRVVDVQKLRTFCDFCRARPSAEIGVVEV